MKRYYQLVLICVTGFSLLCFLFYKHEYERLRKVLEVLDIFGSSPDVTSTMNDVYPTRETTSSGVSFSPDFWRTSSNGLNLFAAYSLSRDGLPVVQVVAFARKQPKNLFNGMSCFLENESLVDNRVRGNLTWTELETSQKLKSFLVTCTVSQPQDLPFILGLEDKTRKTYLPVSPQGDARNGLALCVVPSQQTPYHGNFDLIEFLLYYNTLGINTFYVYHYGVGGHLTSQLNTLARLQNASIELITWNRPEEDDSLDVSLITSDCLLRNGMSRVFTVKSGELLVPQKEVLLETFLEKQIIKPSSETSSDFKFPLVSLCSNIPDMSETGASKLKILKRKKQSPVTGRSTTTRASGIDSVVGRVGEVIVKAEEAIVVDFVRCPVSSIDDEDQNVLGRFAKILEEKPYVKQLP